jgi:protein SCO1/2
MQDRTQARILTAMVSVGLGILGACGPSQSAQKTDAHKSYPKVTTEAKDTTAKRYNLTGRVASIDKPSHSINVDGNEIPGFMAAMTMPYQVKDASILDKLSPGDQIKAEIVMGNDGAYLENVVRIQKTLSPQPIK